MNAARKQRKGASVRTLMVRALPLTGYAQLGTRFIQDEAVPGEARMIGLYLLSKSANWKVDIGHLHTHFNWSVERIYRYLGDLVTHGYCARRQVFDEETGNFGPSEYVLADDKAKIIAQWREWNDAGDKFFPSDRSRLTEAGVFDESELAPPGDAPCSAFPHTVEPYTVNPQTELKRDTTKPTPLNPPVTPAGNAGKGIGAAEGEREYALAPPHSEAVPTQPPEPTDPPNPSSGIAERHAMAAASGEAEGQPRRANAESVPEPLRRVTFVEFWRDYEPHRDRKRDKAAQAWEELSAENRLWAYSVLPQYFGHCGKKNARPTEAWRFLRLGMFRDYQLPKAPRNPAEAPPITPRPLPPSADDVFASPLGLKAAEERWVLELVEFVERNRRLPGAGEIEDLARAGRTRHRELLADEQAVKKGELVAPAVAVHLGKRRMLIEKTLRKHGLAPPSAEADAARVDPDASEVTARELADFP